MIIKDNDLYIAERVSNKISKIDLTLTNPQLIDVATDVQGPHSLALNGNELFITERWGAKISKIDITSSIPTTTNFVTWVEGYKIHLFGDELYISNLFENKLSKINVNVANPTVEDVIDVIGPIGIEIKENILYFTQNTGKVSRIDISSSLSIKNITAKEVVKIFPNPSKDVLNVSGIYKPESYIIYNSLGLKVKEGVISNNNYINIDDLTTGLYLIKFREGLSRQILKK